MKQTLTQLIIFLFCFAICLSKPLHSQFRFSQITVQGNSYTDVETIKSISGLKRNISLSANDINLALKNLYGRIYHFFHHKKDTSKKGRPLPL